MSHAARNTALFNRARVVDLGKPAPPKSSWWASNAPWEAFSAQAREEAKRMRGSAGERMVDGVHSARNAELGQVGKR
jgi:hypothetical protein